MTETVSSYYIAGPMSNLPQFNFPAFDSVASELRDQGFTVVSPAEEDGESVREACFASETGAREDLPPTFDYGATLGRDVSIVLSHVDAVCLLPGWQASSGACTEAYSAMRAGKPVHAWDVEARIPIPVDTTVLAQQLAKSLFEADTLPKPADGLAGTNEVRVTDATGGQKGSKPERLDLIPVGALNALARVYGMGADKYTDHNYLLGYRWGLSYAAMQRHLTQFWSGEEADEESGESHLMHAAWHCFTLFTYQQFDLGTDDRPAEFVGHPERIKAEAKS